MRPANAINLEKAGCERGRQMTSFKMKATLAALLLAGSMVPAVSAETLKIGAIGSLSGGGTAWGLAIKRGAELAVDEVNKAGGLKVGDKTYNIELVMYDCLLYTSPSPRD